MCSSYILCVLVETSNVVNRVDKNMLLFIGGAMGHHRPLRAADSAVPRAGGGAVNGAQRHAPQLHFRVYALPLVLHLHHRLVVVLP